MPARDFFDTNVLIYAVAKNDSRAPRAEALLASGGIVSIQSLNEFVSVARRKLGMSWKEVKEFLDLICILCPDPIPISRRDPQRSSGHCGKVRIWHLRCADSFCGSGG